MGRNFLKYLLIYFIFLIKFYNCLNVSQTILEQATYYETSDSVIYNTFIDFNALKFYTIDMDKIHHTEATPRFEFYLQDDGLINIRCKEKDTNYQRFKCNSILLNEHKSITFDYDFLMARNGGFICFMLILYGIFCLFRGYIYYNLTVAFYSGFSLILLSREFCELMELIEKLDAGDEKSQQFLNAFYFISVLTSLFYGYTSFLSRYFRYISFGFIEGLVIGKLFFYFIVKAVINNIILKYFLTELICSLAFIICWFFLKNKYKIFTMVNISLIASYGIIYGLNVLIGGLPFMPFLILAKANQKSSVVDTRELLFKRLVKHSNLIFYSIMYVILALGGSYFNITNTKIFMEKARKKISVY